jgi:hypothetical protein
MADTLMPGHSCKDFVNKIVNDELSRLISAHGFHYIGFVLSAIVIEHLGAYYDNYPFNPTPEDMDKKRKSNSKSNSISEDRFNRGLTKLGNKYKNFTKSNNQFYLYQHLRCGLVHSLRPLEGIWLMIRLELMMKEKID